MNERIKLLSEQACFKNQDEESIEYFAELIVQDCANFVRETYDHEAAEPIAWNMEIKYGLHGDYA